MSEVGAGLSFWVTVAFTLNYSLGSGFLSLPWAFSKTGTVLGVLVLVVFGLYSMMGTFNLLETIDRGRKVMKFTNSTSSLTKAHNNKNYISIGETQLTPLSSHAASSAPASVVVSSAATNGGRIADRSSRDSLDTSMEVTFSPDPEATFADPHDFCINQGVRKLEINELCEIFLGKRGKLLFTLLIVVYMTGSLWSYGTVFANAFKTTLQLGTNSYYFFLAVFSAVVVPASLLEFSEQVTVQVVLSIFRVVMVLAMVITTMMAASSGSNDFHLDESAPSPSVLERVEWQNLYMLTPIAAYSYIFHHSVPSLEYPVADKLSCVRLFATAVSIAMLLYILVGAAVSAYFGDYTQTSSNLNWSVYAGHNGSSPAGRVVAFFVVLFPALDVASAFPLNAYTLGNTVMTTVFAEEIKSHSHTASHLRQKLLFCRGAAAVLPLLGAAIEHDLSVVTRYTGLAAFLLAFVFPPVLAYYSRLRMQELNIEDKSIHSTILTSTPFQALLLISGIISFFVAGIASVVSDE